MNNIGMSKIYHSTVKNDETWGEIDQSMKIISNAEWFSSEANTKTSNIGKVSAFHKKQKDLSSQILNQTDYAGYAKLSSKQINTE